MAKSTLRRHGGIRVAAVSLLSGVIIAACSPMADQPAPVYMVNIVSTAAPETAAAAPIEREAMAPVALAPSIAPATAIAHPASDMIALDNPPPQSAPAPARQASDPVSTQAMRPPSATPAQAPTPLSTPPTLVASPEIAAPPRVAPPAAALARVEPSAAAEARAEPAPSPVPERTAPEPARADIATTGLYVSVKDDRAAHSRPRYYYSP
jgi:hypothetical protein